MKRTNIETITKEIVNPTLTGMRVTILAGKVKAFHDAKVSSQEAMREHWLEDHPVLTTLGMLLVEISVDFIIGSMLMAEVPRILKLINKKGGVEVEELEDIQLENLDAEGVE